MSEHDGPLVIFKSVPEFFVPEFIGNKPNTVRVLSGREYSERLDYARACLEMGEPASIEVINAETGDQFFRRLTDISQVGALAGMTIWVLSWKHEHGEGTYRDPDDAEEE